MNKKFLKQVLSLLLVIALSAGTCVNAFASSQSIPLDTHLKWSDPQVLIGDGYIIETVSGDSEYGRVTVKRTTYSNNYTVLQITENGIVSTYTYNISDFSKLRSALEKPIHDNTKGTSGFTYKYLTYDYHVVHLTPGSGTWSNVLAWVSMGVGKFNFELSVVVGIASLICNANSADCETYLYVYRYWYEIYSDAGYFLYYYCAHYTYTWVKERDNQWYYKGCTSGSFTSHMVG